MNIGGGLRHVGCVDHVEDLGAVVSSGTVRDPPGTYRARRCPRTARHDPAAEHLACRTARNRQGYVIMFDCDLYSSARTTLAFCFPLIRDRTPIFFDDWRGDGAESWGLGERRALEEFLDGNPDLVAEELEPYFEKGKIFLVTRETPVRRDQISSRTSRPIRAHGG